MKKLQQLREDRDLKQREMAEYLNISRSAYSSYETGANEPSMELLVKMADYFGISVDELIGHDVKNTGNICNISGHALNPRERKLLYAFRLLPEKSKLRVENMIDFEVDLSANE